MDTIAVFFYPPSTLCLDAISRELSVVYFAVLVNTISALYLPPQLLRLTTSLLEIDIP